MRARDEGVIREEFDNWYQHYPRMVSRGAAEDPFGKARVDGGVSLEILIEATKHYGAQMAGKESQFIRYPATWLNGKCWLDEVARCRPGAGARARVVAASLARRDLGNGRMSRVITNGDPDLTCFSVRFQAVLASADSHGDRRSDSGA